MLLIKKALLADDQEIRDYIAAWKNLLDVDGEAKPHEVQRQLFGHMYDNLNILDNKSNSLLQLNGILIAAYTFSAASPELKTDPNAQSLFALGIVYAAVAVFLCLRVIWVHWSSSDDLRKAEQHMENLISVRDERTVRFRRAWTFSAVSLVALALLVSMETVLKVPFPVYCFIPYLIVAHLFAVYVYDDVAIFAGKVRARF